MELLSIRLTCSVLYLFNPNCRGQKGLEEFASALSKTSPWIAEALVRKDVKIEGEDARNNAFAEKAVPNPVMDLCGKQSPSKKVLHYIIMYYMLMNPLLLIFNHSWRVSTGCSQNPGGKPNSVQELEDFG
jgi:hypothetical protein